MLLAAGLVAACGGGSDDDGGGMALDGTSAISSVRTIAPLLDDEGGVMAGDPAAVPEDPAAWTSAAHYATEAQAGQVERAMGATAISLQVDPGVAAAAAVDLAVWSAYSLQASHGLQPDAPVFVRGADLRLAAAAADRIADAGFTRVFLVTR
jgi:hypothetical protein